MVNVKNKKARTLKRTPVLFSSNTLPWQFFSNEQEACQNRMYVYNVRKSVVLTDVMSPDPMVWVELFKGLETIRETCPSTSDNDIEYMQSCEDKVEKILNALSIATSSAPHLETLYWEE